MSNSPLLKHLGEAGLLNDVSALLARARGRDEGNLRKIQVQAKGRNITIFIFCGFNCYVLHCISWMGEVSISTLRKQGIFKMS